MYSKVTHAIEISVEPIYLSEQSSAINNHFVWAYTILVRNLGTASVQLLHRHWKIIDANGSSQEVQGEGVVGVQPILLAGESFEYTSGTHLPCSSGVMMGTYQFCYINQDGQRNGLFTVDIPAFSLDIPGVTKQLN
jgi:ApaG protein